MVDLPRRLLDLLPAAKAADFTDFVEAAEFCVDHAASERERDRARLIYILNVAAVEWARECEAMGADPLDLILDFANVAGQTAAGLGVQKIAEAGRGRLRKALVEQFGEGAKTFLRMWAQEEKAP